jgi:hypothetical protein
MLLICSWRKHCISWELYRRLRKGALKSLAFPIPPRHRILWDSLTVSQLWTKLESIFMIQRSKNNPRNGDTEVTKQSVGICNFACRLPGKGCNHHSKVICCISGQTEAATGLHMLRQSLKRNLVPSRQCCSSQGSHFASETDTSSLWSSESPGLFTWFGPFRLPRLS